MLAKPFFAAGFHRALRREPFHAAVLVGLDRERVRIVRDEKIRDVQMQVRGDVLPALHVAVDSQHLKRENILACRSDVFDAALLADLLERDGEQIIVVPASQPVQSVYFEPDPEPEEPAAEVFTFREDVPLSAELQEVLWDACQEHKVEYALALGLIETESSFNTEAVSYVGCYGLMQLNPDYFPTDLSPAENIQYGVAFIAEKLDQYAGNVGAALTAYNAGHDTGNREYAEKVMAAAERWREE